MVEPRRKCAGSWRCAQRVQVRGAGAGGCTLAWPFGCSRPAGRPARPRAGFARPGLARHVHDAGGGRQDHCARLLRALVPYCPALHVRVLGVLARYAIALCGLALCAPRLYICSVAGSESLMDTRSSSLGF